MYTSHNVLETLRLLKAGFQIVVPVARIVSVAWKELPVVKNDRRDWSDSCDTLVSIKSFVSDQTIKKTGTMAAVNRRTRLLACYLLLRVILRRRREREHRRKHRPRRNAFHFLQIVCMCITGANVLILLLGFLCSETEFLANRFPGVFSGSSVLIILRKFVIKTFIPLYSFHKCRGVIRVACPHFEACICTWSKQSGASWDMSQRFCRFYRLNPVSIKNMRSLESLFRSSLSQG